MTEQEAPAHTLSADAVCRRLATSAATGLSAAEAAARLRRYGPNRLAEGKKRSAMRMLAGQFRDPMILLLVVAAGISIAIGEAQDAIVIVVIVGLNGLIGFVQEYRAEKAMAALRAMAAPQATVHRDGRPVVVDAQELVPGDVVLLEAGQVVPADLRLLETASLKIDEASLTGESVPVEKSTDPLADPQLPVGDRSNLAHRGTIVTYGRGAGVATATGMATEMGRIAGLLDRAETTRTPLQRRLARVSRNLALAALAICAVVFVAGILRGEDLLLMFLTAVSLAVAAVPEALPAVVTISLALGARQMVRRQALIRRLPAVETLGSVTTICTDKTGTLTENRMAVERLLGADCKPFVAGEGKGGEPPLLLLALALSNDVVLDADGEPAGDPTEVALYQRAKDLGQAKETLAAAYPRVAEIPFSSERQAMTTVHRTPAGDFLAFTKGGFEAVAGMCPALAADRAEAAHLELAGQGLRTLAFAVRRWPELPAAMAAETVEEDLDFLGLAGALDPPRAEAAAAVATCRTAGIRPVMITGDHPLTARTIAQRLGIVDHDSEVATGRELATMARDAFSDSAGRVNVYARVAPEQKLTLISALQSRHEAVAMTGDGVNDAPALKQADIGVAMGITGTDVAKEAADMVLLDDNFATIVNAVREGRRIYDNIRKFFKYTLTSNAGEIWTIFLAPFLGLPIPLLPIHILWINLITDGVPGLAMTAEPADPNVMRHPPRPLAESLFAHGLWQHILWVGLLMGGVCLAMQAWALAHGAHWQTMVFTVLCLSQFGHALAIRSERFSLFAIGLLSNPFLLWTVVASTGLQLAIVYLPWGQQIFHTQALNGPELAIALIVSSVVFWAVEIEKLCIRRGWLRYR